MQWVRTNAKREVRRPGIKTAIAAIHKAVKVSNQACLKELCHKADMILWEDAYVDLSRIRGPIMPSESCLEKLKDIIVDGLFPHDKPMVQPPTLYGNVKKQKLLIKSTLR